MRYLGRLAVAAYRMPLSPSRDAFLRRAVPFLANNDNVLWANRQASPLLFPEAWKGPVTEDTASADAAYNLAVQTSAFDAFIAAAHAAPAP